MRNLLFILMSAFLVMACAEGGNKSVEEGGALGSASQVESFNPGVVNIYYFHNKQRCMTCKAIEKVIKEVYEKNYSDNESVDLKVLTIGDDESEKLVEKYEISFSSLIVVSGDALVDLTEQAFANAVNKPEVLAGLVKSEIEKYLE